MKGKDVLPDTMRAVVCHGPQDYRLEEVALPRPGPGEILLEVEMVGICASDAKCYSGAPLFWGDDQREAFCQPPIIPGHEFVGRVAALGEGVSAGRGLEIGTRMTSEQIVPCGNCWFCERGQYWMCDRSTIYGFRREAPGAMAEYVLLPADARNYLVPEDLPAVEAVYIEPLSCAIHAVERGEITFGDVVVVAGCGSLGLGMIAAAHLKNPALVVGLDLLDYRLDLARICGADLILNPGEVDVVEEIRALTDGRGCDVYIEASGHPDGVRQGLHAIRKLGTFVEFSLFREPVSVDWTIIGDSKELDIHGAHLGPYCFPLAIEMLSGGHPAGRIVTDIFPLEDYETGLNRVLAPEKEKAVKVALAP